MEKEDKVVWFWLGILITIWLGVIIIIILTGCVGHIGPTRFSIGSTPIGQASSAPKSGKCHVPDFNGTEANINLPNLFDTDRDSALAQTSRVLREVGARTFKDDKDARYEVEIRVDLTSGIQAGWGWGPMLFNSEGAANVYDRSEGRNEVVASGVGSHTIVLNPLGGGGFIGTQGSTKLLDRSFSLGRVSGIGKTARASVLDLC